MLSKMLYRYSKQFLYLELHEELYACLQWRIINNFLGWVFNCLIFKLIGNIYEQNPKVQRQHQCKIFVELCIPTYL